MQLTWQPLSIACGKRRRTKELLGNYDFVDVTASIILGTILRLVDLHIDFIDTFVASLWLSIKFKPVRPHIPDKSRPTAYW